MLLHCSHTVAACLHILHALTVLPACMSCRSIMTLMSDALETYVPSCTDRPTRLFFMLKSRSPRGATGHVAAVEPTSAGRRGPEPYDTWQRRSPLQLGGEVWSRGARGSVGVYLSQETRFRAIGHVAATELISAKRR
jgi:hypothetical protein